MGCLANARTWLLDPRQEAPCHIAMEAGWLLGWSRRVRRRWNFFLTLGFSPTVRPVAVVVQSEILRHRKKRGWGDLRECVKIPQYDLCQYFWYLQDSAVWPVPQSFHVQWLCSSVYDLPVTTEHRAVCNSHYFLVYQMERRPLPQSPVPCRKRSFWTDSSKGGTQSEILWFVT